MQVSFAPLQKIVLENPGNCESAVTLFKSDFKIFSGISLFIFLFILFFEPFGSGRFDFNNQLLFVTGFGGITFLMLYGVRIAFMYIQGQTGTRVRPALYDVLM